MNDRLNQDLWRFIEDAVQRRGDHPLWIQRLPKGQREVFSYQRVYEMSLAVVQQLRDLGVEAGDRVGVLSANGPYWGAMAFATWRLGAVVAPLHSGNSDEELMTQCLALAPRCSLYTDSDRGLPDAHRVSQDTLQQDQHAALTIEPGSEAVRIYTSGSTGNPKLVRLSHRNILSNVGGAAQLDISIDHSDRFLSLLPLSHAMEMTGGLLLPMHHGASVVLPRVLAASEVLEALVEEQITLMIAVPRLYRNIMLGMEKRFAEGSALLRVFVALVRASPNWLRQWISAPIRKKFGGRMKCWLSGGSRLDPDIGRYFRQLGFPLIQGYGLTECSPVVSVQSLRDERVDSVGTPLSGMEVRINEPDASGDGELWVRGPSLMLGYSDDSQTEEVMSGDWYKTGDIARLVDGKIVITGRSKRLIVTEAGKNVYPEDIEIMLEKHPDLKEAGVLEVDMRPAAVLALEDADNQSLAKSIVQDYNKRASSHNQISRYALVDELPRTPLGKVAIKDLPDIFKQHEVTE